MTTGPDKYSVTPHGTRNCYDYWGCRCEACTKANRDDQNRRTKDRYEWTATYGLPPDVDHGEAAYNNWGCRCDVCRGAKSAANKRQRTARLAYATEHGIPDWVKHGNAYVSWGCRCETCRATMVERSRRSWLAHKGVA